MTDVKEWLVLGPPGTGKTTYLSRQIENAAKKYDRVFVASFTKAAAEELVGRQLPIPRDNVGTLHSHCFRALDHPLIAERYLDDWNRQNPDLRLSGDSVDLDDPLATDEQKMEQPGDRPYSRYQILRARMVPREAWPMEVQGFAARWEAWKRDTGTLDFTDLIEYALSDCDTAPGRPQVGFYDEVQDCTALELALIRKWAEDMDFVILAGDDDQAIYGFRGATPKAFLRPDLPQDHKRVLSQSHRIPRRVHAIATAWIKQVEEREPKEYHPRDYDGEVRRLARGNWRKPEAILEDAMRYVEQGKTVMLLAACGFMLEPTKQVLRKEAIPFHNPYRRKRADWNPLYVPPASRRGQKKRTHAVERVLAFLRMDPDTWGDAARLWSGDDAIMFLEVLLARVFAVKGGREAIKAWAGKEEVPLDEMAALLTEDAFVRAMDMDLDWLEENLQATRRQGMSFPIAVAKKHGGRALREEPKLIIGTIHSVKGGQADVVYVFPDLSRAGMQQWMAVGEPRDGIIRQFYVAMTRARESLVIAPPASMLRVPLWELAGRF